MMDAYRPEVPPTAENSGSPARPGFFRPLRIGLLGGLAHSVLMLLALPPLAWWPASLAAVLPLAWAGSRRHDRIGPVFLGVTLGALPLWGVAQWWTRDVSAFGFLPFVVALALFPAGFVACLALVRRRWPAMPALLAVPLLWTAFEFFRGEVAFDGYAWGFAAHPLIDAPMLAAPAVLGGYYLVSLLPGLVAGGVLDGFRSGPGRSRRLAGALLVAPAWAGLAIAGLRLAPPEGSRVLRVAAVQTNVAQSNKIDWSIEDELADFARFEALTRQAAGANPDFIAWPETMVPGLTLEPGPLAQLREAGLAYDVGGKRIEPDHFRREMLALQTRADRPLVVGEEAISKLEILEVGDGAEVERRGRRNSVYVLDRGRVEPDRYDKVRLTPFGETMPYIRAWPWLQRLLQDVAAAGMTLDLESGGRPRRLHVRAREGEITIATPICFESTASDVCRHLVFEDGQRRADLLVNVTNDGWFGDSDLARAQHLQIARWRCLETATPMLRAANTGVSTLLDARGRVVVPEVDTRPSPARAEGVIVGSLRAGAGVPLAAGVGDGVGWAVFASGTLLTIWAGVAGRLAARRGRGPASPAVTARTTPRRPA